MRIKCLCILLLMTPILACHKITLSAIEAPITHHADWQPIQSEYHQHFSAHVGDIYVLKASQTASDLPLWFNQQVTAYYTQTLNQSTLQQQKLSGKNVYSMYAIVKKNDLAPWRRVEMYALADYVIWVNIDNNIDSISYEAMQSFISDLVFKLHIKEP